MNAPVPTQAKQYTNTKVNNDLNIEIRANYTGTQPYVPFNEVVRYSTNKALLFFVGANVLTTYYINKNFKDSDNQKYMYIGASLFFIQIIYNYLDINDSTNLSRLQAFNSHN
jgi:hypothetical protein